LQYCANREAGGVDPVLSSTNEKQEKWMRNMSAITIAILVFALVGSIGATAALCMAIERHSQREGRRLLFGLAPLDFP
jgi:hypothetical protein